MEIMERDLKKIISEMTLEEKAGMCSGEDFWRLKKVERLGIGGYGIRWTSRIKKAARRGRSSWDWREYCGGLFSGSLCHGFQL